MKNKLIDLNRWFKVEESPARNGRYLLMVAHRRSSGHPTGITVVEKNWNKKAGWDLPEGIWPMQWKYITAADKVKYFRDYNEYNDWIEGK